MLLKLKIIKTNMGMIGNLGIISNNYTRHFYQLLYFLKMSQLITILKARSKKTEENANSLLVSCGAFETEMKFLP